MSSKVTALDEIDRVFEEVPGFRVIGKLQLTESGVDPIGLRQLNLDLMDATVPGINNVTEHIRPYTFMSWAWWKASKYATPDMAPALIGDLVERYEAIYAWSHSMAGKPLRGNAMVRRYLNPPSDTNSFTFAGENWEAYKERRTGFMAPTEYGPSIKALHFLQPDVGGLFGWSAEAEPAILAIDAAVSASLPENLLRPGTATATLEEIEPLARDLPFDEAMPDEARVFRYLFHEIGAEERAGRDMRRRKATIDLIRSILTAEGPLHLDQLRRQLSISKQLGPLGENEADIGISAMLLCHLQCRQLQRLATESMMMWVEFFLSETRGRPRTTEAIVEQAHECAAEKDPIYAASQTVGDYVRSIEDLGQDLGWPAAAALPETDVVDLLRHLRHAQRKDRTQIPALAIRSFAVVRAVTKAFALTVFPQGVMNAIELRPDRMPMGLMARRLDALADRPLEFGWKEIVESWIIGQHVHWSAVRGGDGKKRLRIGLEGDGWMLVRASPSRGFDATPDRLWTLLSLGAACGLFEHLKGDRWGASATK